MRTGAKDSVPSHHPGRFVVSSGGRRLDREFGADGLDWDWEPAGTVQLEGGEFDVVRGWISIGETLYTTM